MKKTIKQKVELRVNLPKRVTMRSEVPLEIALRNGAQTPIIWSEINGYDDCLIEIVKSNGTECPKTSFGKEAMQGRKRYHARRVFHELVPGEEKVWKIDLQQCFEFSRGKYSLSASIKINPNTAPLTISVEGVEFEVK